MKHQIALIPGDGIGPEVSNATRTVVESTGVDIEWVELEAGGEIASRYGTPLPQATLDAIVKAGIALKGPIATPVGSGFASVNVQLRKTFDLYANFRPSKSLPGVKSRYDDVDLIVIRENTEGLYSGLEHIVIPGVVESLRIITEKGSERIIKFAFDTAKRLNRRKVTVVHKANILKLSDGLFLEVARKVARDYPSIEHEEAIVDATAMKLVLNPADLDVLVMENLFGDILSDLTSGLVGGLGMAPSANIGEKYAIFEAVHGSANDIAGKGIANPTALILSAVLMLRHLGESEAAQRIEDSILNVLKEGRALTGDLGGRASTADYVNAVVTGIRNAD